MRHPGTRRSRPVWPAPPDAIWFSRF